MKRLLALFLVAIPLLLRAENSDIWYAVQLENQHVGWAHNVEKTEGGKFITQMEMEISIKRGLFPLTIKSVERFVETEGRKPIEASSTTKMGIMDMVQEVRFGEKEIELTSRQGTVEQKKKLPYPEEKWLTPGAARDLTEAQLKKGTPAFSYKTVQYETGFSVIEMTLKKMGEENIEVLGKTVPAIVWEQTTSLMPGMKLKGYVDEKGRDLKVELMAIPGMRMTLVAADEQLAKAKAEPVEMLASTLVKVEKPIANPRNLQAQSYEILWTDSSSAPDWKSFPEGASQKVEKREGNRLQVRVDMEHPEPASSTRPDPSYLAASAMLNHEDPKVSELVKRALAGHEGESESRKAERLRRFVRGFMTSKDLSVGFATASEVARTAQGDCTEHAVLLAALLRGAGIPSRTVSGLVYVDEFVGQQRVFGYHMWAQGWIRENGGGRWTDLDAALSDDHPFDATHIALSTSAMSEASVMNDLVRMIPMIGHIRIEPLAH